MQIFSRKTLKHFMLYGAIIVLFCTNCSKEDTWEAKGVTTPSIEVQSSSKIFDYTGGDMSVEVNFQNIKSWEITSSIPSWLSVSPTSGGDDTLVNLNLNTSQSSETISRASAITIIGVGGNSGNIKVEAILKIKQTPNPEIAEIDSYDLESVYLVQNNGDAHENNTISMTYKICSSTAMSPASDGSGGYTFSSEGNFLSFDINVSELDDDGLPPAGTYYASDDDNTATANTFDCGYYYTSGYYGWDVGTFFGTVNAAGTTTSTQYISDGIITLERENEIFTITAYLFDDDLNEFICNFTGKLEVYEGSCQVERDLAISSSVMVSGQKTDVNYSVILPDDYSSLKKYPVLYLLHGYGGNNNSWLDDGNAALLTSNAFEEGVDDFIVVMPDGYNAFYCNGYQSNYQYMTFFFDEFIPYIESEYSINKNKRVIAGLSMGGFGTLYNSLLHPEMFDLAYAMSPAIMTIMDVDLFDLAASAGASGSSLPKVIIACGTSDYVVYNESTFSSFDSTLGEAGFSHELILDPGYSHTWDYWQLCYTRLMNELGELW